MLKKSILSILKKHTNLSEKELLNQIVIPPQLEMGDYALPCFQLAKKLKKPPEQIAKQLTKKLQTEIKKSKHKQIEKINSIGPYINFFIKKQIFASQVINQILKQKQNFGSLPLQRKRVMMEYSAPNTNKPLHLGHLRNDSIGMSISNLLEFTNQKVIKANLLSDRGVHICKVMLALKNENKKPKPGQKPDHFIGELYRKFEKQAKQNPQLLEEAQQLLKKWEAQDKQAIKLWKITNTLAIQGINQTYKNFGSKFDVIFRESNFYNKAKPIIKKGLAKHVFVKDKTGAIQAKLSPLPDKVILRADKTSVYITNDLALTEYKFKHYKLHKAIWVVASEQNTYFKQLFKILKLLGHKWADSCHHLSYGLVHLKSGRMKSREGTVVDADNLIADITKLAEKEINKRAKLSKTELKNRAKQIALSAIKFYLLKTDPKRDILFMPKQAISFEGETGPYLQYAHARASSILTKAKIHTNQTKQAKTKTKQPDFSQLKKKEEIALIRELSKFPPIVERAASQLRPDILTTYTHKLSQIFTTFYTNCPVIKAPQPKKELRLTLVKATKQVIGNALKLLNITPLESM